VEADIAAMNGRTFSVIFGGVIALLGVVHIIYSLVAKRTGGGSWWAGRNLYLEAEENGDPIGFKTVVRGNVASGVFMVVIGSYLALTGH
jgi:hypothetical protein